MRWPTIARRHCMMLPAKAMTQSCDCFSIEEPISRLNRYLHVLEMLLATHEAQMLTGFFDRRAIGHLEQQQTSPKHHY